METEHLEQSGPNVGEKIRFAKAEEQVHKAIATAIDTRMVRCIIIEEEDGPHTARGPLHAFIRGPFGTGRSTALVDRVRQAIGEDMLFTDTFTIASFVGSIGKDGRARVGEIAGIGGKCYVVDEWNNVKWSDQTGLLSILGKAQFRRSIGFKEVEPKHIHDSELLEYHIENGVISGHCTFGCIALANYFPSFKSKKGPQLLSRFLPADMNLDVEGNTRIMLGKYFHNQVDHARVIDKVIVRKDEWKNFHIRTRDLAINLNLYPYSQPGFLNRSQTDCVRLAVQSMLETNSQDRELTITCEQLMKELPFMLREMMTFQNAGLKAIDKLRELNQMCPGQTNKWYAEKLDVWETYVSKLKSALVEQGDWREE